MHLGSQSSSATVRAVAQLSKDFVENSVRRLKLYSSSKPWMRSKEMSIFQEVIERHQPLRCLEWGAGLSTLYFPKLLPASARWYAIEHNEAWAIRLKTMNQSSRIEIHEVSPNVPNWQGDGTYGEFENYLEFPGRFAPFDLIIIDGRARKECLKIGAQWLSERGVIILHDANRTKYHDGFESYPFSELFQDYHKGNGGVWVGSRQVPIKNVINVERHKSTWKKHEQLMGWLR